MQQIFLCASIYLFYRLNNAQLLRHTHTHTNGQPNTLYAWVAPRQQHKQTRPINFAQTIHIRTVIPLNVHVHRVTQTNAHRTFALCIYFSFNNFSVILQLLQLTTRLNLSLKLLCLCPMYGTKYTPDATSYCICGNCIVFVCDAK